MNQNPLPSHQLSDSNRRIIDSNHHSLRVYQVWKGSNIFFLGGRLIFGPDAMSLYLTVWLIVAPVLLFCSFVSQSLIKLFPHHLGILIVAIAAGFTAFMNYRYFFMFVCSTTLLCLYVFAFCWVNIKKIMDAYHCNLWAALMKSPVSGILIIYTFTVQWFVGGLTAFHFYLVMTNQTTYEKFRYRYDRRMNPYNLGYGRNFREILLSRIPSSRNNFREMVKADSSSAYNSSSHLGRAISPDMAETSFMGKRQGVNAEFDDLQHRIGSSGGLERCGTQPRHGNWDHKGNWEMTPEVLKLAADFEMEREVSEKENNHGGH